jgi:DNA-binding beta-propeller fold protein YncE
MGSNRRLNARIGTRASVALGTVLTALLLAASPASAAVSHTFSFSYGALSSTPTDPYPLSGPTDVAVDQATQDVYVTDPGNHRVEKFDKEGNLILIFGKAVNATSGGDVCVISTGNTCQAGISGSAAGDLAAPTYLAVDNSGGPSAGDVYVGDDGDNVVSKFDSEGHLITGWGNHGQKDGGDATDLPVFGPLFGLAVAGNGHLYIGGHHYSGNEWEYTQDGSYIKWYAGFASEWLEGNPAGNGTFYFGAEGHIYLAVPDFSCGCQDTNAYQLSTGSPLTGFALDPVLPELYQDTGSQVDHYSDCAPVTVGPCEPEDSFGSGDLSGARGVGVDGTTHEVYVANTGSNEVAVFGDARPAVTTGPQEDATETSVTLTGHIDPEGRGNISSCQFEWGFNTSYGHILPCEPDPSTGNFTGPTDVKATVLGLSPGTVDHYRLVAENTVGARATGKDLTFITTQPPAIDGLTAENLTATTADLKAKVNPNGLETSWHFEYGPTIEYGQVAPVQDGTIPAGNADQEVSVHLEDLVPHVVYHYRLVATNANGSAPVEELYLKFFV